MTRQILARGTVFGVMRRVALFALVLACILLPAVAQAHTPKQYVLARPKHQHCRAGYVRKVEKGKRREHNHVRETVCVRTPSKASAKTPAKTTTPTLPAATPPAKTLKLHAHLDPTFVQNPANPFQVTYSYSASATSETSNAEGVGVETEAAPLPEGVLSLYSNGSLACAINVGGEATGGECPVTYTVLGTQTVTTIYSSGSVNTTETSTENIEPVATTTMVNASYEARATPEEVEHNGPFEPCDPQGAPVVHPYSPPKCETHTWWIGNLTATATSSTALGGALTPVVNLCGGFSKEARAYVQYEEWWEGVKGYYGEPERADIHHFRSWFLDVAEGNGEDVTEPLTIAPEATEAQCPVSAGAGGSGYTSSTARTTAVIPLPTTEP